MICKTCEMFFTGAGPVCYSCRVKQKANREFFAQRARTMLGIVADGRRGLSYEKLDKFREWILKVGPGEYPIPERLHLEYEEATWWFRGWSICTGAAVQTAWEDGKVIISQSET